MASSLVFFITIIFCVFKKHFTGQLKNSVVVLGKPSTLPPDSHQITKLTDKPGTRAILFLTIIISTPVSVLSSHLMKMYQIKISSHQCCFISGSDERYQPEIIADSFTKVQFLNPYLGNVFIFTMSILGITNPTRILQYKNIPYIGHSCQYIAENVSIYCVKFINI